jgi:hypothetical protein
MSNIVNISGWSDKKNKTMNTALDKSRMLHNFISKNRFL